MSSLGWFFSKQQSDVFTSSVTQPSRLIAGTTIGERQHLNKGVINPFQGRIVARSPLICTNVAEGHTKVGGRTIHSSS